MGIRTDISTGIYDYLETNGVTNVAWPNVNYDESRPYYRVYILPAPTSTIGLKNFDEHSGYLQVDIVINEGIGEIVATSLVDSLLALFPRNLRIVKNSTTIQFNKTGWDGPPQQEPNGYFIPVSIPYQIFN